MASSTTLPLCLTMGEPRGIGGELALKSWLSRIRDERGGGAPVFFCLDAPARLRAEGERLGLSAPVREIAEPGEAGEVFAEALPVLPLSAAADTSSLPVESVRQAVALALAGKCAGVVTNPVNKQRIAASGIEFRGHTEMIAELCGVAGKAVMLLASPQLRVVPASVHMPLREVGDALTPAWLEHVGRVLDAHLRRVEGIAAPVLMFAGLNPHAGEEGLLGDEETRIIAPAIAALRAEGIDARGPAAADSLFHEEARRAYDAAVCMYHDQALIPFKTLAFHEGVNVTLGLPIVRTSPDHGTAEDIAGRGIARPDSMLAALRMAAGRRGNCQPQGC